MKPKFEIGDRVKVTTSASSVTDKTKLNGCVFEIKKHCPRNYGFEWNLEGEHNFMWASEELELVSKAKPIKPKSHLDRYHFFASESNPVDIERVAKENPEAVGGAIFCSGAWRVTIWLRQEFCDQFEYTPVERVEIADQVLHQYWGVVYNKHIRIWNVEAELIPKVISQIKAAKAYLESRPKPEVKPEAKPKSNEKRTKVTVITF